MSTMKARRCGACGQVIRGARATHPQTKYCANCAKGKIRHKMVRIVLISGHRGESPVKARANTLDDRGPEGDVLLARMQTRRARKGMEAGFNASPAELGRAAVNAARKRR